MMGLEYFAVLGCATILVVVLTYLIWVRVQSPVFALGTFLLYYWSLFGAWQLVWDLSQGITETHYAYLFGKMFFVELDGDYYLALIFYSIFLVVTLLGVLGLVPRVRPGLEPSSSRPCLTVSHRRLVGLALGCVVLSFLLVMDRLAEAMILNRSGYDVTASSDVKDVRFLLHQVLNSVAVIPATLGLAVFVSGSKGRFVRGRVRPIDGVGYLLAVGLLFAFGILMGNKNELFGGMIMGLVFYLINVPRPRIARLAVTGTVGVAGIAVIDFVRSVSLLELASDFSWSRAGTSIANVFSSNEAFAAHFSMYGALHHRVGITWGSSVESLVLSFVPRMFWAGRPDTIYQHYVDGVGALPGQGYTIHHATGWYLNFGLLGVLAGALALGLIWGGLFRGAYRTRPRGHSMRAVYFAIGFAAMTGTFPVLVRNGLEVYKPVVLFSLLLPLVIFKAASWAVGPSGTAVSDVH